MAGAAGMAVRRQVHLAGAAWALPGAADVATLPPVLARTASQDPHRKPGSERLGKQEDKCLAAKAARVGKSIARWSAVVDLSTGSVCECPPPGAAK